MLRMFIGKQQIVLMFGTLQFIIPKKSHILHLAIRNSIVFTYSVRIEQLIIKKALNGTIRFFKFSF